MWYHIQHWYVIVGCLIISHTTLISNDMFRGQKYWGSRFDRLGHLRTQGVGGGKKGTQLRKSYLEDSWLESRIGIDWGLYLKILNSYCNVVWFFELKCKLSFVMKQRWVLIVSIWLRAAKVITCRFVFDDKESLDFEMVKSGVVKN